MLKPPHPCARAGCLALIRIGNYCAEHRAVRPSARTQGYSAKWDRYSKHFLKLNPFCADPFRRHPGLLVEAKVTGHKVAHKGDETLLMDPNNHYPLCVSCNAYQCVKFEGGFGRAASSMPSPQTDRLASFLRSTSKR